MRPLLSPGRQTGLRQSGTDLSGDNIERVHLLSAKCPLVFRKSPIKPYGVHPYLLIDKGLSAKISRPVYYQLADYIGEEEAGYGRTGYGLPFR